MIYSKFLQRKEPKAQIKLELKLFLEELRNSSRNVIDICREQTKEDVDSKQQYDVICIHVMTGLTMTESMSVRSGLR